MTALKLLPQTRGLPVFGNLFAFLRAGGAPKLHEYIDNKHKRLGDIFLEKLGNVEAVFISSPQMMRTVFANEGKKPLHVLPEAWTLYNRLYGSSRGLFFMDDDEWVHYRRNVNNIFKKANDAGFMDEATSYTAHAFIDGLDEGYVDDLEDRLYRWSLDTITALLIGPKLFSRSRSELDGHLCELSQTIRRIFETSAQLQFVPAQQAVRYNLKVWKDFDQSVDDALHETSDLVHRLMEDKMNENEGLLRLMVETKMLKSDIMKIVIDLIMAAGDTTSYTMQWILYCLSKNPLMQKEEAPKNILKEALRLYPVAPFLTRILRDDINLCQYLIPKGSLIIYSLYTAGRDPRTFKDPLRFQPNRWSDKSAEMAQSTMPFAMGIRSCVGRKLAETQLLKTLQEITKEYRIEGRNDREIKMVLKMVSVPHSKINLRFVRKDSVPL